MLTARVLAGRSTRFWGYVDHDRKDHDEAYRETQGSRPASVSHLHHPLSGGVADRLPSVQRPCNYCTIWQQKVKPSRPGGLAAYSAWDTQAAVGAAVRVERRLVRRTGPCSSELLQDAAGLGVRHVHQVQHALVGRAVIRPVRHKRHLRFRFLHVLTSSPFAPPDRRGAHIRATETKKFKNR